MGPSRQFLSCRKGTDPRAAELCQSGKCVFNRFSDFSMKDLLEFLKLFIFIYLFTLGQAQCQNKGMVFFVFKLKYSWFTKLCYFQVYSSDQLYTYIFFSYPFLL